ncbi:hypothetical protein OM076_05930 [Solirubrobacter ginsenosidimutans]|uniref:Uncharacterized protein n=1 Tax=Solirubrobacter ginsenosidimutans TaxID=490573 RepID=A0A9X3MP42_9ACTN|nr:hypothetical protein [Solirubrobacter ginsenosidimutans]MDA0159792.1 hypothetical protein [Solirubrobacter ginsenosidimutans]
MQVDRIAGVARLAGGVRGLGVCDVLRVELDAVQRPGLLEQLTVRTAALERAGSDPADDAARVREELRVLARVRAGLPSSATEPFTLTGPAGLVLELVGGCLTSAVAAAHARLGEGEPGVPWVAACERELEAAAAWITTSLECQAVEAFCFEPGADPVHAW